MDERRRSLVSRDAEGKFTSRGEKESDGCQSHDTAKTMAVSGLTVRSHTKQRLAESYHLRALPTDGTSRLNMNNSKVQEVMDIMMTETFVTHGGKRTHEGIAPGNLDWTAQDTSPFGGPAQT